MGGDSRVQVKHRRFLLLRELLNVRLEGFLHGSTEATTGIGAFSPLGDGLKGRLGAKLKEETFI